MYKNILLSIDLEQESSWKKTLPMAKDMCQLSGGTLHILAVAPEFHMSIVSQYFPENYEQEVGQKMLERLKALVQEKIDAAIPVQHIVGQGTVYEVILQTATKIKADLIVMASHRPELKDYLLGPNAARVVRHANCSVLVVRD